MSPERKTGKRNERAAIPPGTEAPRFKLPVTPDQKISLDDFSGSPVVLVFYPADWSPVCSDEVALFNEVLPEFRRLGAYVVGISADSVWSHLAWAKEKNLHFPLLSDFHPKGKACRSYQAYDARQGVPERAIVLVGPDGKIAWSHLSPMGVNPGADGVLDALERLQGQLPSSGDMSLPRHETAVDQPMPQPARAEVPS